MLRRNGLSVQSSTWISCSIACADCFSIIKSLVIVVVDFVNAQIRQKLGGVANEIDSRHGKFRMLVHVQAIEVLCSRVARILLREIWCFVLWSEVKVRERPIGTPRT